MGNSQLDRLPLASRDQAVLTMTIQRRCLMRPRLARQVCIIVAYSFMAAFAAGCTAGGFLV